MFCFFAGMALLRSAPVQGVSRPPHAASRDCRTAHPLPVRSRVRLHRNAGSREKRNKRANDATRNQRAPALLPAPPHAAQRAVTGWRGGLGRVGADLASAGSMRPPPSPARHVSTVRLATKHVSRETACHHKSPARNGTPRQHGAARHQTRQPGNASRETARHHKSQARNGTPRQHGTVRHHTHQPRNGCPTQASRETAHITPPQPDVPQKGDP